MEEVALPTNTALSDSHTIAINLLDKILDDFGLKRRLDGSRIVFQGDIPNLQTTQSDNINLSLIGTIPSIANALAASQIYEARGGETQIITADLRRGHNYLDADTGMTPTINGQEIPLDVVAGNPFLGGIYQTKDGRHVVPSAVYVDLVYQWSTFLSCAVNTDDVATAIKRWHSKDLEKAAEQAGLPFAIVESEETWKDSPQGEHMSKLAIVPVQKVTSTPPKKMLPFNPQRPLQGIKVLCVTHAIAGPSAGRTLAEHGATVLQIMYTHGFEHPFVYTYANLGCASSRLNLHKTSDIEQMWNLIADADVWIDSYREGALVKFGFTNEKMLEINPNLIISHVRLYGTSGPWESKAGFDMQGSSSSGMMALCGKSLESPCWPPGQVINDYTTGYYGALAIQATLLRRMKEGGGYIVSPSLTGTAMSIVKHFKSSNFPTLKQNKGIAMPPLSLQVQTGLGLLKTLAPLPIMSSTPAKYDPIVLVPLGSSLPVFAGKEDHYNAEKQSNNAVDKETTVKSASKHGNERTLKLKQVAEQALLQGN